MHRVVAAVLAVALSGCAIRGEGHQVAYAIDGVAIGVGAIAIYQHQQSPMTEDPGNGPPEVIGGAFILAGIIGAVVNAVINQPPKQKSPPPATNSYPYVPHPS